MNHHRRVLVAAVLGLQALHAGAADAQSDTLRGPRKPLFTWRDVTFLGGMIAITGAVAPLDKRIAERLQDSTVQENRFYGRVASFVRSVADPGAVVIGVSLYGLGRLTDNERMADLGLHGTEALAIGTGLGWLGKGLFGRERPFVELNPNDYKFARGFGNKSEYMSFPSGHTIAAFAAAAAVTSETSRWWPNTRWIIGPALYGGAALTGVSRMYNNRHWASDVLMGAAIGTLSGLKVVRYHHSHPHNDLDRWLLSGSIRAAPGGGHVFSWSVTPSFMP
ncbi:MAG TPA: phosphatase PAP2 family protein [Gemmatimonadaceae bacterium]|nr:phosphatase PAP2 family protein [Gemmatimonadaceae bacterium]